MKNKAGFSLLELLVVLAIFSVLAVVATESLILSLRGARKSDALIEVRSNVDIAIATMERQIRNASEVDCPNPDKSILNFKDANEKATSFSCVNIGQEDSYMASSSARLTSENISITSCILDCQLVQTEDPPQVIISLSAEEKEKTGSEKGSVTTSTTIFLRNY